MWFTAPFFTKFTLKQVCMLTPLIAKATTTEGHHQGLFGEKERERVNKSSGIFAHGENLEEKVRMKRGKIENFCEFLDYMYYDQVNKKLIGTNWGKIFLIRNSLLIKGSTMMS